MPLVAYTATSEAWEGMVDFYRNLPKVELHAHLNGSLSEKTVRELMVKNLKENIHSSAETVIAKGDKRTLQDCFDMFKVIQKLTIDSATIKFATKAVIYDFVHDGVLYLELRSTPRSNSSTGLTKRMYIEAILEGIQEYQTDNPDTIHVHFLLSIDRRLGSKEAEDTVHLALEYKESSNGIIVGVDFSGDPNAGDGREYISALKMAKASGLKLALHMAEIKGLDDENTELLSLPPDRIGHGTFLHESVRCEDIVKERRIPFEICLTSNVKGGTVESFAEGHHHIHKWKKSGQPIVLCTDDKGVFSTTLSNEYGIAADECGMTREEMFVLSRNGIDCIFANDDVKTLLRSRWDNWKTENAHFFE